jgi:basic membrane protein A
VADRALHRIAWVLFPLLAVVASWATGTDIQAANGRPRPQVVLVTFGCTESNFLCPAFVQALRRTGVTGRVISPDDREDPVGTLSLVAAEGPELVIVDASHADALATVARAYPKTHFALYDTPRSEVKGLPGNVQAVVIRPGEAAYLAGWLAARLEQRRPGKDVVGAVGGLPIPPVKEFITGFREGARRADPGITVLVEYSHDFADPNACDAVASDQIARGAGVIFNVAGSCGLGALAAAKRAGVWGIGVDTDQSFLGPYILTSVMKRYDTGFLHLFRQLQAGTLRGGGTTVLTLRNGGAALGPISPRVPAALRAELDRMRQRIEDGELTIPRS